MVHYIAFKDPMYGTNIKVFIGEASDVRQFVMDKFGEYLPDEDRTEVLDKDDGYFGDGNRGMSFEMEIKDGSGRPMNHCIWLDSLELTVDSLCTLFHEMTHHPIQALDYVGIIMCDMSEEAYAYYTEYVVKQILEYAFNNRMLLPLSIPNDND